MTELRILLIEDEPDIRELVKRSLCRDRQLAVQALPPGEQTLAEAAAWRPDLILCDVMMPEMDGPATLARLRSNPRTAGLPVVFITAHVQQKEIAYFESLGVVGVIAKPFDPLKLAEVVRAHWRAATSDSFAPDSSGGHANRQPL